MKRVILTGGTGFVGANLARRLLRDGHELRCQRLNSGSIPDRRNSKRFANDVGRIPIVM